LPRAVRISKVDPAGTGPGNDHVGLADSTGDRVDSRTGVATTPTATARTGLGAAKRSARASPRTRAGAATGDRRDAGALPQTDRVRAVRGARATDMPSASVLQPRTDRSSPRPTIGQRRALVTAPSRGGDTPRPKRRTARLAVALRQEQQRGSSEAHARCGRGAAAQPRSAGLRRTQRSADTSVPSWQVYSGGLAARLCFATCSQAKWARPFGARMQRQVWAAARRRGATARELRSARLRGAGDATWTARGAPYRIRAP
jgi:hypothetical protein